MTYNIMKKTLFRSISLKKLDSQEQTSSIIQLISFIKPEDVAHELEKKL